MVMISEWTANYSVEVISVKTLTLWYGAYLNNVTQDNFSLCFSVNWNAMLLPQTLRTKNCVKTFQERLHENHVLVGDSLQSYGKRRLYGHGLLTPT